MFINDVGESTWEEINVGARGANYGWPATEGADQQPGLRDAASTPTTAARGRRSPAGRSTTRRPCSSPPATRGITSSPTSSTAGSGGSTRRPGAVESFATDADNPVDLRVGADGSLYYLARGTGRVFRVQFAESPGGTQGQGPSIAQQPESRTVPAGGSVTFGVLAAGSPPLSYRWQRDGVNIAGATGASYTISARAADSGALFRVVVSNAFGSVTSAAATLTVTGGRRRLPPRTPGRARAGRSSRRAPRSRPPRRTRPRSPRQLARQRRLARRQALLLRQLEARRRRALRRLSMPGAARPPRLG